MKTSHITIHILTVQYRESNCNISPCRNALRSLDISRWFRWLQLKTKGRSYPKYSPLPKNATQRIKKNPIKG